jgi:hypothetical protein
LTELNQRRNWQGNKLHQELKTRFKNSICCRGAVYGPEGLDLACFNTTLNLPLADYNKTDYNMPHANLISYHNKAFQVVKLLGIVLIGISK